MVNSKLKECVGDFEFGIHLFNRHEEKIEIVPMVLCLSYLYWFKCTLFIWIITLLLIVLISNAWFNYSHCLIYYLLCRYSLQSMHSSWLFSIPRLSTNLALVVKCLSCIKFLNQLSSTQCINVLFAVVTLNEIKTRSPNCLIDPITHDPPTLNG